MVRIAITVLYVFSTLFGSGLCCCTFQGRSRAADSGEIASHARTSGCGCQSKIIAPEQPATPAPAEKSCPCRDVGRSLHALKIAGTKADETDSPLSLDGLVNAALPNRICVATASLASPARAISLPFRTTGDLLYVFHILRC